MSDSYYYNKGAQDAAEDEGYNPPHSEDEGYNPPHSGFGNELLGDGGNSRAEDIEDYDQGYFHTRGQIDQGDNNYNPPSNSDCKEAYDEGWEAAKNS